MGESADSRITSDVSQNVEDEDSRRNELKNLCEEHRNHGSEDSEASRAVNSYR